MKSLSHLRSSWPTNFRVISHEGVHIRSREKLGCLCVGDHAWLRLPEDPQRHGVPQKATEHGLLHTYFGSKLIVGYYPIRGNLAGDVETADGLKTSHIVTL